MQTNVTKTIKSIINLLLLGRVLNETIESQGSNKLLDMFVFQDENKDKFIFTILMLNNVACNLLISFTIKHHSSSKCINIGGYGGSASVALLIKVGFYLRFPYYLARM